jgi:hypothetical protein
MRTLPPGNRVAVEPERAVAMEPIELNVALVGSYGSRPTRPVTRPFLPDAGA